jgi:predicted flap endonuclease-1-like 5' DNA nuclease
MITGMHGLKRPAGSGATQALLPLRRLAPAAFAARSHGGRRPLTVTAAAASTPSASPNASDDAPAPAAPAPAAAPRRRAPRTPQQHAAARDALSSLNGVGPRYRQLLGARGIHSVEQLALTVFKPGGAGGALLGDKDAALEYLRVSYWGVRCCACGSCRSMRDALLLMVGAGWMPELMIGALFPVHKLAAASPQARTTCNTHRNLTPTNFTPLKQNFTPPGRRRHPQQGARGLDRVRPAAAPRRPLRPQRRGGGSSGRQQQQ